MNKKDAKWHHEIVHFPQLTIEGRIPNYDKVENFCSYTRWFLLKLFVVIPIFVLVLGIILGWYLSSLAIFLTYFDLTIKANGGYGAWLAINSVIILIVAISLASIPFNNYTHKKYAANLELEEEYYKGTKKRPLEKPDGFLKLWYMKWKYKFCPKIEY